MHPGRPSTSRILYDVPCVVCRDHSSGKHYGVFACDGCAGFFKRSVRRDRQYICKARVPGSCLIDKVHRNQCRACRLAKCLAAGMNRDAVQHERGPRTATIRRNMAYLLNERPPRNVPLMPPLVPIPHPNHLSQPPPINALPHPFSAFTMNPENQQQQQQQQTPPKPPSPIPQRPGELCEAAARILFISLKKTRLIPRLEYLSFPDRLHLFQQSWKDIFLLGCAQYLYPVNFSALLSDPKISVRSLQLFQDALERINIIKPDQTEYNYLQAIVLFRTCFYTAGIDMQASRLADTQTTAILQEYAREDLLKYTMAFNSGSISRFDQVMQVLLIVNSIPTDVVVDLFFRSTVGDTPIDRIVGDMFRSDEMAE